MNKNTNHQLCVLEEVEEPMQISKISQAIQNECACKCHPRCKACVRCNEAYHQLPFPPRHGQHIILPNGEHIIT